MKQFVQLGPEVKPGVREIVAVHTWRLMPDHLSRKGDFHQLPGEYSALQNLVTDYCYFQDGKVERKAPLLKAVRGANRSSGPASSITWGAMGFGYGSSFMWFNYAVIRELVKHGIPVKALAWGKSDGVELPRLRSDDDIKNSIVILNVRRRVPPNPFQKCCRLAHSIFGYFQCEGTLAPNWLVDFSRHFDVMLATSTATKQALEDSGVKSPIHIFGHGIDPAQFPFVDRPVNRKPYTFFHFADVQWRKGTDVLLEAFKALPRNDIRLYIKAQWENPESKVYRKKTANDPRIVWDFKRYKPEELSALVARMDCGIFPSRGEGFGMPKLECEATGLPCIATNAFGYSDTSTPNGTLLLDVKEWVPARVDFGKQAEPSLDHLIALMSRCADNPEWAKECGRLSGLNAHSRWKWSDKIGELLATLRVYGFTPHAPR